jgi:hypothetical protein
MAGLIVGLVLRIPITDEFNTEAKFIATVYADHAWEDGTHAYPAVDTVAEITGLSPRTVQRYLRILESILLIHDGYGPRGQNKYKFPLEINQDGSVRLKLRVGGVTVSPRQGVRGDSLSGDSLSGDTGVTQTNNPSFEEDGEEVRRAISERYSILEKLYTENVTTRVVPLMQQIIRNTVITYPDPSWYEPAFFIFAKNTATSFDYLIAILESWKNHGFGYKIEIKNGNGNGHGKVKSMSGIEAAKILRGEA